jgi:UV DNA damage endonuclease
VVYDNLHDRLNPSLEPPAWLPRLAATWQGDIPKVHFSSAAEGRRAGAHADYADPAEFAAFLQLLQPLGRVDVMLEAKAKDLALLALAPLLPELIP